MSALEIQEGDWVVYDVVGGQRRTEKAVIPLLTIKRGQTYAAGWGPRPWGWPPDTVSAGG